MQSCCALLLAQQTGWDVESLLHERSKGLVRYGAQHRLVVHHIKLVGLLVHCRRRRDRGRVDDLVHDLRLHQPTKNTPVSAFCLGARLLAGTASRRQTSYGMGLSLKCRTERRWHKNSTARKPSGGTPLIRCAPLCSSAFHFRRHSARFRLHHQQGRKLFT